MQVSVSEAKARFAELIRRAEAGEPVTITRHGRPAVELQPSTARGRPAAFFGAMAARISVSDDIHEGDDEIAAMFRDAVEAP